jgi:hypothetical protein
LLSRETRYLYRGVLLSGLDRDCGEAEFPSPGSAPNLRASTPEKPSPEDMSSVKWLRSRLREGRVSAPPARLGSHLAGFHSGKAQSRGYIFRKVASIATAGRQASRPAGSAPILGAFTPEKALKSGLFPPLSAGLIGGSQTLPPHIRLAGGSRDSEVFFGAFFLVLFDAFYLIFMHTHIHVGVFDQRETSQQITYHPAALGVSGRRGLSTTISSAPNGGKRPPFRAFCVEREPGRGAERWRQPPPARRDHNLQTGTANNSTLEA